MQSQVTCWVVTDGRAGMENQCLGLAEALGLTPVVKRIRLRQPWRELSPYLRQGLRHAFSSTGDVLQPPWPDLLIASGRASVPASLYVRQASRHIKSRPPTFTVQIQDPRIDPNYFDLLIVPQHDQVTGSNVLATRGGLHRLTPALLATEASALAGRMAGMARPYIAVLIGGNNGVYQFLPSAIARLALQLNELGQQTGGTLLLTPSRRTDAATIGLLQAGLNNVPHYMWDRQGANPYFGMLGMADAILVTPDSVNMVSEACSTGKPVHIIELPGGSDKFNRFHTQLRTGGLTRPFTGVLEQWTYPPLDDVAMAAARVKSMMNWPD